MPVISVPRAMALASVILLSTTPDVAHAYMGPGLGLGFLGAVLGVIGSILLGIAAIVWYPIKRLLRKFRRPKDPRSDPGSAKPPEA